MATSALVVAGTALPAQAQTDDPSAVVLDEITVVPSRTEETATESMTSTSIVGERDLERLQPSTPSQIFQGMPGVTASNDGNPTSTNINIRGLQDAGRVAVIVDGARRNFQINGHRSATPIWIEPEMLKSVTVVRGPVSNIYGSGAIGGVVAFETKDADDFLRPEEMVAGELKAGFETNGEGLLGRATAAVRLTQEIDVIGNVVYRDRDDYRDGAGNDVPGTGFDILGGNLKTTIRPSEFSRLTLGWIGDRQDWGDGIGEQEVDLEQDSFVGSYEYDDPSIPWLDLKASAYINTTTVRETRLVDDEQFAEFVTIPFPPPGVTFPTFYDLPAGTYREYDLTTTGFDIHNTSRFQTGAFSHALTYGGDWFHDDVETSDTADVPDAFNPSGVRSAGGAFIQDRIEYADWFELQTALRYDTYRLDGMGTQVEGDHLSPRITVGVKPFEQTGLHGIQVYGTYAEGYRAPTVGETLVTGIHPVPAVPFEFLPNPNLQPETAHTFEVGVNVERDDIFRPGDGLRVKAAFFHNEVEDYIENVGYYAGDIPECSTPSGGFAPYFDCLRNENISEARIRGFEFEGIYDTGQVFAGLRGHVIRGDNLEIDQPLATVPADQITALGGFRLMNGRLTLGGEAQFVDGQDRLPDGVEPTDSYTLVNLFASYQATENFRIDARVDNLLDEDYRDYLNPSLGTYSEPGINAKLAATVRFGVEGRGIFDN